MNIRGLTERAMYSALQQQHRRFLRAASRMNDVDDEAFLVREKEESILGEKRGRTGRSRSMPRIQ